MNDITPKDATEQKAVSVGKRITTAIGIIATAGAALCAAVGGLEWISDNLPLLATNLGLLAAGGIGSYIAVRRMNTDRKGGE